MTLPPGQQRVLDAVDAYLADHGYAPSERELAGALRRSRACIHGHLTRLIAKGLLVRDYNTARSLRRASA
jgi:SOS-response transcriptional repressor LexA